MSNIDLAKIREIRDKIEQIKDGESIFSYGIKPDEKFPVLYHYSTGESVHSILDHKEIYVSKSNFLNDMTEIEYFKEVFERAIQSFEENQKLFDFSQKIKGEYYNSLWLEAYNYFILSFSTNGDSLPLWSNYSQGVGYNIEFCQKIDDIFKMDEKPLLPISHKVIYDAEKQYQKVVYFLKNAYECYSKAICELKENFFEDEIEKTIIFDSVLILKRYAIFFKRDLFQAEEEYRICFLSTNLNVKDYRKKICREIFFRMKDGNLIPYIKIKLSDYFLKSICIGPTNNSDITKIGWELFFQEKHFDGVDVKKSQIPLRY